MRASSQVIWHISPRTNKTGDVTRWGSLLYRDSTIDPKTWPLLWIVQSQAGTQLNNCEIINGQVFASFNDIICLQRYTFMTLAHLRTLLNTSKHCIHQVYFPSLSLANLINIKANVSHSMGLQRTAWKSDSSEANEPCRTSWFNFTIKSVFTSYTCKWGSVINESMKSASDCVTAIFS